MALLEATLTGVVVLVALVVLGALALGLYGTVLLWRARRVARRAAALLAARSHLAAGADGDRAPAALPRLPHGDAGVDGDTASSSLADDLQSRLIH